MGYPTEITVSVGPQGRRDGAGLGCRGEGVSDWTHFRVSATQPARCRSVKKSHPYAGHGSRWSVNLSPFFRHLGSPGSTSSGSRDMAWSTPVLVALTHTRRGSERGHS